MHVLHLENIFLMLRCLFGMTSINLFKEAIPVLHDVIEGVAFNAMSSLLPNIFSCYFTFNKPAYF